MAPRYRVTLTEEERKTIKCQLLWPVRDNYLVRFSSLLCFSSFPLIFFIFIGHGYQDLP